MQRKWDIREKMSPGEVLACAQNREKRSPQVVVDINGRQCLFFIFSSRREVEKKLEKRDVTQWLGPCPHPVCHPACFPSIFWCLAFLSLNPQKPPEASHLCLPWPIPQPHVIFFILPAEFLVRIKSGRPREAALSRLYAFELFPTI